MSGGGVWPGVGCIIRCWIIGQKVRLSGGNMFCYRLEKEQLALTAAKKEKQKTQQKTLSKAVKNFHDGKTNN